MTNLRIMIIGPPLGGKTTVSKHLAEVFSCEVMSSGDYARSLNTMENSSALAVGDLSPDHLAIAAWVTEKMTDNKRIIMDGYPRSMEQYKVFDWSKVDLVIWMDVPVGELLARTGKRGREDDDPKTFMRRYMNYMKHTAPLMLEFDQQTYTSFIHYICTPGQSQIEVAKELGNHVQVVFEEIENGG